MFVHSKEADLAVAELMNCLMDGSIDPASIAHRDLSNAVNEYLIERGFFEDQLADVWNGEIQLTSS